MNVRVNLRFLPLWLKGPARVLRAWLMAALVVAFVEIGLRTGPLPRLAERLGLALDLTSGTLPPRGQKPVLPARSRADVDAATWVVAHWPAGDTCLRRCLVLGQRLRHLAPVLRIGVRRLESGELGAHSWLEIGGLSLDPDVSMFATMTGAGEPEENR
jgi:hypothetical protein